MMCHRAGQMVVFCKFILSSVCIYRDMAPDYLEWYQEVLQNWCPEYTRALSNPD